MITVRHLRVRAPNHPDAMIDEALNPSQRVSSVDIVQAQDTMCHPVVRVAYDGLRKEFSRSTIELKIDGKATELDWDSQLRWSLIETAISLLEQFITVGYAIVAYKAKNSNRSDADEKKRKKNDQQSDGNDDGALIRSNDQLTHRQNRYEARHFSGRGEEDEDENQSSNGSDVVSVSVCNPLEFELSFTEVCGLRQYTATWMPGVQMASRNRASAQFNMDEMDKQHKDLRFMLLMQYEPTSQGRLTSPVSVITPMRLMSDKFTQIHLKQANNHGCPFTYLRHVKTDPGPIIAPTLTANQANDTKLMEAERENQLKDENASLAAKLEIGHAMILKLPNAAAPDRRGMPGFGAQEPELDVSSHPVCIILPSFELANGPVPPAPHYPEKQFKHFETLVCSVLGTPLSTIRKPTATEAELDDIRFIETKQAHMQTISRATSEVLSQVFGKKSIAPKSSSLSKSDDIELPSDKSTQMQQNDEVALRSSTAFPASHGKLDAKQAKPESVMNVLAVSVTFQSCLSISSLMALFDQQLLRRDATVKLIANQTGLSEDMFISEQDMKDNQEEQERLQTQSKLQLQRAKQGVPMKPRANTTELARRPAGKSSSAAVSKAKSSDRESEGSGDSSESEDSSTETATDTDRGVKRKRANTNSRVKRKEQAKGKKSRQGN